jgi:hypothetical protein
VIAQEQLRIVRALPQRERYKYVLPLVLPEGAGWKIVSPNCSRNVDPAGGDIEIAWFEPQAGGLWRLHARNHGARQWRPAVDGLTLEAAIERVCADPLREYWV